MEKEKFIKKAGKIYRTAENEVHIEHMEMELRMLTQEIQNLEDRRRVLMNEINAFMKLKNEK